MGILQTWDLPLRRPCHRSASNRQPPAGTLLLPRTPLLNVEPKIVYIGGGRGALSEIMCFEVKSSSIMGCEGITETVELYKFSAASAGSCPVDLSTDVNIGWRSQGVC